MISLKDKETYFDNYLKNKETNKIIIQRNNAFKSEDVREHILRIYGNIYTIENAKNQNWENCFKTLSNQIKKEFGDFEK